MDKIKSIGGFFELDFRKNDVSSLFHDNAIALNSGRNSLEYLLREKNIKHLHIPYYTCEAVLEPITYTKTSYSFYHISNSFLPLIDNIGTSETVLYTNYFGIMQKPISVLCKKYPDIIIDNSQSFFDLPLYGVSSFYSPRKFFGVPDGGFLYDWESPRDKSYERDFSYNRCIHLLKSIDIDKEAGYIDFLENEKFLKNQPIKQMSELSKTILKCQDFNAVANKRVNNFNFLHQELRQINILTDLIDSLDYIGPMVYPLYVKNGSELRRLLIESKVFVPQYWTNILSLLDKSSFEFDLVENLLPLPIDQRYSSLELRRVVEIIQNQYK